MLPDWLKKATHTINEFGREYYHAIKLVAILGTLITAGMIYAKSSYKSFKRQSSKHHASLQAVPAEVSLHKIQR